eukprot:scaffold268449_cov14-Tisochrysis_lutea.AAC.1
MGSHLRKAACGPKQPEPGHTMVQPFPPIGAWECPGCTLAAHCPQTLQDLCRKVALRTGEVWKGPQGCGAFRSGSSA